MLVHDLLLAKKGVALPASHGLRTAVERHKARLQAEFTKARIRRKLSSVEAFKAFIESGLENGADASESPYPRWVRINTLKTTLEDQLETTFAGYGRAAKVEDVRHRRAKRLFIDGHIPNLVAISPNIDLSKSEAYKSGAIILQDKASCFPAYLLDPLPQDGDIIDTCSAPGNKTSHLAAILLSHSSESDECLQIIHAFEKNKGRAETLQKMVNVAGSHTWTKIYPGQDFLKTDPASPTFKNVGALLLDPSCSGSGIVGRDDMPELDLPVLKQSTKKPSEYQKKSAKPPESGKESRKRKREESENALNVMVDDDGEIMAVNSGDELKARLDALSKFQFELLLHALKFPAARKITYSTCSIHAEENETVIQKALASTTAKERGWRIMRRDEQIRGMREWPVRGSMEACDGDNDLADSCIRASKGDEHGTMGFFLAGFIREETPTTNMEAHFLRDERGHIIRDLMGFPVRQSHSEQEISGEEHTEPKKVLTDEEEEWGGFGDDETQLEAIGNPSASPEKPISKPEKLLLNKHAHGIIKKRLQLGVKHDKKRRKGKLFS